MELQLIGWRDLHYDEIKAALKLTKMSRPTSAKNYRNRICLARGAKCEFCPLNIVTGNGTCFCHLIEYDGIKITWREVAELFQDEINRRDTQHKNAMKSVFNS